MGGELEAVEGRSAQVAFAPAPGRTIAEIPTVHALDDSLPFSARHTHARVMKIWKEEFDALYAEGCLVPLTLHLRGDVGSTRAARIAALQELLGYMATRPGVRASSTGLAPGSADCSRA